MLLQDPEMACFDAAAAAADVTSESRDAHGELSSLHARGRACAGDPPSQEDGERAGCDALDEMTPRLGRYRRHHHRRRHLIIFAFRCKV